MLNPCKSFEGNLCYSKTRLPLRLSSIPITCLLGMNGFFYVENLQELINVSCHIDQFLYWKGRTVCNILCRKETCTLFDIQQCKILNKWCHNNGDVIRTDWNFLSNRKAKKMQCQSFCAQTCAYNLQVNYICISTVNYKNVAQKISKQNSSNR